MSRLYASLNVSPSKKRSPPEDDDLTMTPKKLRTAPPTPVSISRSKTRSSKQQLSTPLTRLLKFQTALQQALSHALATCAISPSSDSGLVMNVLNHISLKTYSGLTTSFGLDDLKQLCWIWEWDGESKFEKEKGAHSKFEEDNPFLDLSSISSGSNDWTRQSMGFVMSATTHYSKSERKRVPAYGVGIEVEMDIDKGMGGGMAAVARWTAAAESRSSEFLRKLEKWVEFHANETSTPPIPFANLPPLPSSAKTSSLTRNLASQSPKGSTSPQKFPIAPTSPSRSPSKEGHREFAVPFPVLPSPTKSSTLLFPQTPSRRHNPGIAVGDANPQTIPTSNTSLSITASLLSTPVHQRGSDAGTAPQTPSTSRRQALYERIRQRSLSKSPTKSLSSEVTGGTLTRDQMVKMGQEEMRRRCLLGRLSGIAESIWMLFTHPASGPTSASSGRKRRTIPLAEVAGAIVKSSPVPISMAEACESLNMLVKLCPFYLKKIVVAGNDWLEMPSSNTTTAGPSDIAPVKRGSGVPPANSGLKVKTDHVHELVTRSPKTVKNMVGGLREVREIIRREMELED